MTKPSQKLRKIPHLGLLDGPDKNFFGTKKFQLTKTELFRDKTFALKSKMKNFENFRMLFGPQMPKHPDSQKVPTFVLLDQKIFKMFLRFSKNFRRSGGGPQQTIVGTPYKSPKVEKRIFDLSPIEKVSFTKSGAWRPYWFLAS